MTDIGEAHRQHQIALEAHRADPDDEQTHRDLVRARMDRDRAWIEYQLGDLDLD